jgi:hypothetical protein
VSAPDVILRIITVLLGLMAVSIRAADQEPTPKTHMRDVLRARMTEDAKKAAPATGTAPAKSEKNETPESAPTAAPTAPASSAAPAAAEAAKTAPVKPVAQQPATVLPKVEVKKDRITVLDQKLAKQEQDIAREKKNLKSTEVDLALNDSRIAKPLSIFGGESAQFRKRISSERVELMEAEKDIIEAIARAKTKKEKDELQKQLDELRTVRRELEKSLR